MKDQQARAAVITAARSFAAPKKSGRCNGLGVWLAVPHGAFLGLGVRNRFQSLLRPLGCDAISARLSHVAPPAD
jgi:hypothetical protein